VSAFDRLMLRVWRWLPGLVVAAGAAGYAFGTWLFGQGQ
jgi:hypothetical protein